MANEGNLAQRSAQGGFSLLFPQGERPDSAAVERALAANGGGPATIVHRPDPGEGWLELLASGMSFDISGLVPGPPGRTCVPRSLYGLDQSQMFDNFEAVYLAPGPHIASGGRMLPVVRVMAGLVAALAELLGARGVIWHPAETLMDSSYFARVTRTWLEGGAFPALGLTTLEGLPEGGARSFGLSFFLGQEVLVMARPGAERSETSKLAFRTIDFLIRNGPLPPNEVLSTEGEDALVMGASQDGLVVSIWREQ